MSEGKQLDIFGDALRAADETEEIERQEDRAGVRRLYTVTFECTNEGWARLYGQFPLYEERDGVKAIEVGQPESVARSILGEEEATDG